MRLDDPELVRREYAAPERLAQRSAAYQFADGPDTRQVLFDAIAEVEPATVLEVGCGHGWLSEWVQRELGCSVLALDASPEMVALARERSVDARLADAEELPFADASFDVVVAAWMLYHVSNVDRALGEFARVLRPGGRLVAVTNSQEHLRELAGLLGAERPVYSFSRENGEAQLRRHFRHVEARHVRGTIAFPTRADAQRYVDASIAWGARQLPELQGPVRVTCASTVFVADA